MTDNPPPSDDQAVVAIDLLFSADDLVRLATDLRAIFRTPDKKGLDRAQCQQIRFSMALLKIARFLKGSGVGTDVAEQFSQLGAAFHQLQYGVKNPVFKAAAVRSRPLDRTDVWMGRVTAVSGLECLLYAGLSRKEAAACVVKNHPAICRLCRPGTNATTAPLSWRDAFRAGKVSDPAASGAYEEQCRFFDMGGSSLKPSDLRLMATSFLRKAEKAACLIINDEDQDYPP
jgi:hypothetical protein